MPIIDVDEVLISLDIACQSFSVVRRTETRDQYGESVLGVETIPNLTGSCQPLGDNSLLREEAFTTGKEGLTVWSSFRFYTASRTVGNVTYQPDLVLFDGNYYLVRLLEQWTQWGEGFTKVECVGYDYVQTPPNS